MSTPIPRSAGTTPYEVCAYHTRTGEVAAWIPLAAIPDWERGLNMSGSWTVQVALDDRFMTKAELTACSTEWDWSWAICQGTHIWQAGPVKGEDYGTDGANTTSIQGVGLLQLLVEKRVLVNAGRMAVAGVAGIDADLSFGTSDTSDKGAVIPAANQNLHLATIIKRIFQNALAEPGGDLPIDLPAEEYAGSATRTYPGFELGTPGQRALDITQVIDGPELELVPYFTTPARRVVRHRLLTGTPATNGRLGNLTYPHAWDSGRGLCELPFSRHGERRTNRDWEKGEGSDRNIQVGFAQDLDGVTTGHTSGVRPLLESVGTGHANASDTPLLDSYAAAEVTNGATAMLTLKAEVRTDGTDGQGRRTRSPKITDVSPGDTGVFNVRSHRRLPDRAYEVRVLRMRGGRTVDRAALEVQVLSGGVL